jgi:hypothetical protein
VERGAPGGSEPALKRAALVTFALLALGTAAAGCGGETQRAERPHAAPVVAGRGPAVAADPRPCARQPTDAPGFFTLMTAGRTDGWLAGDLPASVDLRDGRVLWLFGDTWIGARDQGGGLAPGAELWHNSALVQTGGCADLLNAGGTGWLTIPGTDDFWWPSGGFVPGGTRGQVVDVFVTRIRRTGTGVFDFVPVGADVVELRRADLAVVGVRALPFQDRLWASSVVADGRWLYLFGRDYTAGPSTYLARGRAGDLFGRWQFWTGRRWTRDPAQVKPVVTYAPFNNPSMARLRDGRWLAIAKDREFDGAAVIGWTARRPQGPWRATGPLVDAPTSGRPAEFTYLAVPHAEITLRHGRRLLVSWNVNTRDASLDGLSDPAVAGYGPRFSVITVPRDRRSR